MKRNKDTTSAKYKKMLKNNLLFVFIIVGILIIGSLYVFSVGREEANKNTIYGDDVVDMYYFHLSTCPHCHKQNEFHKTLLVKYPNLRINAFEVSKQESISKYVEFANRIEGLDPNRFPGTPLTIIGEEFNVGFASAETTGVTIEKMISEKNEEILSSWEEGMVKTIDLITNE